MNLDANRNNSACHINLFGYLAHIKEEERYEKQRLVKLISKIHVKAKVTYAWTVSENKLIDLSCE